MDEFDLIRHFFSERINKHRDDVVIGIGDDCAVLEVPYQHQLVMTTDTLVNGVHFPISTAAKDIGHKSLAVNLSDLAAMSASPAWVTLALTLPKVNEQWLSDFSDGFFSLANQYGVELIGGDTTKGPLAITIQAHGFIPKGCAVTRSGAKPGDLIYVSNTLGDAGLALKYLNKEVILEPEHEGIILKQFNCPEPRIKEGLVLREMASAMIDISDGLVADLGHILEQSKVGAEVYIEKLPISSQMRASQSLEECAMLALTAGDDYELCFTIPKDKQILIEEKMQMYGFHITCIGEITLSRKLKVLSYDGRPYLAVLKGYAHF